MERGGTNPSLLTDFPFWLYLSVVSSQENRMSLFYLLSSFFLLFIPEILGIH